MKKPKKRKRNRSGKFLMSWEWRTLRYTILMKYDRRCMCCGACPDDGRTVLHVDHIKPRHRYPELSLDENNLQILCSACNQGKGAWDKTDHRGATIKRQDKEERRVQRKLAQKALSVQ